MNYFYTYMWLREDGVPYYVGKGSGQRAFDKRERRFSMPNDSARILIQEFPSEREAFEAEKFLIAYYGRVDLGTGCLRNLTDGGENPPSNRGKKRPLHAIQRTAAFNRGRKLSAHHCNKLRIAKLGKSISEDHKRNIGLARQGTHWSEEIRQKMRQSAIARCLRDGMSLSKKKILE